MTELNEIEIERHPWEPFAPAGARILFLGTFPPPRRRWAMDFYYPNPTNDFWRIMGLLFRGDTEAFYIRAERKYRLEEIKSLLVEQGIALSDTAVAVRRLRANASDAHLQIVEPRNVDALVAQLPQCRVVACAGEKSAATLAALIGTEVPAVGCSVTATIAGRELQFWRLPSSSRAYPMAVERKAQAYAAALAAAGLKCEML
jgi:hypoxanthine-DNA glycosylase